MKHKQLIIALLATLTLLPSCKKVPLSIGETVVRHREVGTFSGLVVNDNINVTLVRSDSCFIEVAAGENIIDNILTEVADNTLTISNDNKIDWIRTYDYRIDVTLHFKDIRKITYGSSGELRTVNQFNAEDTPYLICIDGGSGDISMEINNCSSLKVEYIGGTSLLRLTGEGNSSLDLYKKSFGLVHAEDLDTDSVKIVNIGTGDCWVKANKHLHSRIERFGNIYYKGEPDVITEEYGEKAVGRLIRVESL